MSKKFEHTLAFHCGPAILGIKASNLINLSLADYPNILDEIKHLNKIFNPYYYFMVLSKKNGRIPVSCTHLTLPTNREVLILSVVAVLKKKD